MIAKQERIRRSERATAAIARLRRLGKTDHLGRPRLVVDRDQARRLHEQGVATTQRIIVVVKAGSPAARARVNWPS